MQALCQGLMVFADDRFNDYVCHQVGLTPTHAHLGGRRSVRKQKPNRASANIKVRRRSIIYFVLLMLRCKADFGNERVEIATRRQIFMDDVANQWKSFEKH